MPYFKDQQNKVHFLDDAQHAYLLPAGCAPISEQDADALLNPVSSVKTAARAELIAQRNAAITGGFTYNGKQIDSDRDSVMAITGAAVAALAAKAAGLPYSVDWTCADDSVLTLNADGVLGMAVALAMFADAQHARARPLKEAIKNAPDAATAKGVRW